MSEDRGNGPAVNGSGNQEEIAMMAREKTREELIAESRQLLAQLAEARKLIASLCPVLGDDQLFDYVRTWAHKTDQMLDAELPGWQQAPLEAREAAQKVQSARAQAVVDAVVPPARSEAEQWGKEEAKAADAKREAASAELSEKIWTCKIGGPCGNLPYGADGPMRKAVEECFFSLTGTESEFTFSGWGGFLTPTQREIVSAVSSGVNKHGDLVYTPADEADLRLYAVSDSDGATYIPSRNFADAVRRWKQWLVDTGDFTAEEAADTEPESVTVLDGELVLPRKEE